MFTYAIIVVDDTKHTIQRCELSVVIITVHGGCTDNLDCLAGVFPLLLFSVCGTFCMRNTLCDKCRESSDSITRREFVVCLRE